MARLNSILLLPLFVIAGSACAVELDDSGARALAQDDALAQAGAGPDDVAVATQALSPSTAETLPLSAFTSCMTLKDSNSWATAKANADTIGSKVLLSTILGNAGGELNRSSVLITSSRRPQVPAGSWKYGFEWDSGDQTVNYWVPQGMALSSHSGIYDAFVAWYWKAGADDPAPIGFSNKGVRVSIASLDPIFDSPAVAPRYRHALLIEPTGNKTYVPVVNHAGGVVVHGNYLYLADTSRGIRVFDLANIRLANTSATCSDRLGYFNVGGTSVPCAFGYKYMIPQVNLYARALTNGTTPASSGCYAKFSFLGEDTTQATDVVLSGEYCKVGEECATSPVDTGGRLYRWPIDGATGRLKTTGGLVVAERAYTMNRRNIQGVAPVPQTTMRDDYRLSSSRVSGALFYVREASSVPFQAYAYDEGTWSYFPEGLHASETGSGNLWVDTEGTTTTTDPAQGGRAVYAVAGDLLYHP